MLTILEILSVLSPNISGSKIAKLSHILTAIFQLSQKVTTRSIGRLSVMSLRSIERFYANNALNWTALRVSLFAHFCHNQEESYLLVGDETTQKKQANVLMDWVDSILLW